MGAKNDFYRNQAETIIKKLKLRKMDGYYCDSVDEAKSLFKELLGKEKKIIGYGGSMTIDENGFKDAAKEMGHELIVREIYKTPEAEKELNALMINADAFMMSTNAITLDGELINIDGRANRLCYLLYGPETVYVITGMNKVVKDVNTGLDRVRNFASPPNTVRLNCDTPCAKTGRCGDCLENTICCQIVITRASRIPGRIKVILIGDELGY